ncbi:MAG: PilZ domain-containing protein [Steroidobacterales bacterium]
MADSFLGDGLILDEMRPLAWLPGPLAQGGELANLNADNLQLLIAEASIEETRATEALKEESPAVLHELQRLEYKLNILLRLTAELTMRQNAMPKIYRMRLSAQGLEWSLGGPTAGASGLLQLYINASMPQPLLLPCIVEHEVHRDSQRVSQLRFAGLSEPMIDALDKLIFRHHRRLIASSRQSPG